ncbi:MAG TPA: flavin reductase [Actinomycetota bacterium]|nr:flavin reductase [Actinomycetota bacterium]
MPGSEEAPPKEFEVPVSGVVSGAPEIAESPFEDVPEEPLEIAGEEGDDPAIAFRRTLGMFATGVTIVTTQAGDQVHGMTANAFMSVSLRPPLILISVDKRARMNALLRDGVRFGVSVLSNDQRELSDRFAGRALGGPPEAGFLVIHDTPLVEGALAHLVARTERSYWGGDHSLFLGRVEYARYGEGTPLLFHGGQYEQLLAKAPVFSALSPELLEPILASGEERAFAEGEVIVRQGGPGDLLYVILEGRVHVERGGRLIETLREGEFFGEVAVLDGRPRSADVVAATPVRALTISRDVLRELLQREPRAAWAMLEVLAARLRAE